MLYLVLIFLFFFLIASITALLFSLNTLISLLTIKVPYVVTPKWAIEKIINYLNLRPNQVVYELGAGDARFLIKLKKKFPKIKAKGFEIAWWPFLKARSNIKKSGLDIELIRKNFYNADLSGADLIFCFLIDSIMPKLEKQLLDQLKNGAMVISYGFTFPNWQAKEIISNPKNEKGSKIHIYIK